MRATCRGSEPQPCSYCWAGPQVREAAKRSVLTEAGLGPNALPREVVGLKGFEAAVITAASAALDEWKAEAHKGECCCRGGRAGLCTLYICWGGGTEFLQRKRGKHGRRRTSAGCRVCISSPRQAKGTP